MKTELNKNEKLSTEQETPTIANVLLAAGRSCINCENYYFADDPPYPEFSCTEGHWRGIGSIEEYAELFNEIDCKDFTPCR